jgi:hypothetical protein
MRFRFRSASSSIVIAGVHLGLIAGQAFAAEQGTERPLQANGVVTTTLNLCTSPLSGTIEGPLTSSHLGLTATALDITITPISPTTAVQTGGGTFTAANGDVLFVDFSGIITGTSPTTNESTTVFTITGGTGRFQNATGTFTAAAIGGVVSTSGCTQTLRHTVTSNGTISY